MDDVGKVFASLDRQEIVFEPCGCVHIPGVRVVKQCNSTGKCQRPRIDYAAGFAEFFGQSLADQLDDTIPIATPYGLTEPEPPVEKVLLVRKMVVELDKATLEACRARKGAFASWAKKVLDG